MMKYLLVTALAVTLAAGIGYADQSKVKVIIPISRITPTSGKQMFVNYCAPCHGVDGKGHGPAASALKTQPNDITVLSRSNHGKFPDAHVIAVLQNGSEIPAHGSVQMPVWGPILGKMNQTNPQDRMLRVSNLSRFLDNMQVK